MAIRKLNSCCFCVNLELGVKILGFIKAIFGTLAAVYYLLEILGVVATKSHGGVGKSGTINIFLNSVLTAISGIILLMGIYKRNPGYVRICWIINCVLIFLSLIAVILGIVGMISGGAGGDIFGAIIELLLEIYFTWVIYSYYLDLKSGNVTQY